MSPVNKKKNSKARQIFQEVVEQVAEVYLYLLVFYAACFLVGYFSDRWKSFFNWPAFHISVIVFGILSLFSVKGKKFIQVKKETVKRLLIDLLKLVGKKKAIKELLRGISLKSNKVNFKKVLAVLKNFAFLLWREAMAKIKKFQKKDFLKVGFIALVLIGSLFEGVNLIGFLILGYGLTAFLFVFPLNLTAVLAGLFFIFCPILTIAKKEAVTGLVAVYAYYFLLIAAACQLRMYWSKKGS